MPLLSLPPELHLLLPQFLTTESLTNLCASSAHLTTTLLVSSPSLLHPHVVAHAARGGGQAGLDAKRYIPLLLLLLRFLPPPGEDILAAAVAAGNSFATRLLLRHGAPVAPSVLRAAVSSRRLELLQLLLRREAMDYVLGFAVEARWEEGVEVLVRDPRVSVDACDGYGCSVLHWAARWGWGGVVRALLKRKEGLVLVRKRDGSGFTPLHYAVVAGREEVLGRLLAGGEKAGVWEEGVLGCREGVEAWKVGMGMEGGRVVVVV